MARKNAAAENLMPDGTPWPKVTGVEAIHCTVESPVFGKLTCVYEPDLSIMAERFKRMRFTGQQARQALRFATKALDAKIKENLRDAMIGLIHETTFDTVGQLNGHLILGDLDRTGWANHIRRLNDKACAARLEVRRGPQLDRMVFLRQVVRSVKSKSIEGKITQQLVADAMGVTRRRLQQRIYDLGFTWLEIKDIIEPAREKKTKELTP